VLDCVSSSSAIPASSHPSPWLSGFCYEQSPILVSTLARSFYYYDPRAILAILIGVAEAMSQLLWRSLAKKCGSPAPRLNTAAWHCHTLLRIIAAAAGSTQSLAHALVPLALWSAGVARHPAWAACILAGMTMDDPTFVWLLVPLGAISSSPYRVIVVYTTSLVFWCYLAMAVVPGLELSNALDRVSSILSIAHSSPNLGMAWYLFVEVFDHFRSSFVLGWWGAYIVLNGGLVVRWLHKPYILTAGILSLRALWHPFPTSADTGLAMVAALALCSVTGRKLRLSFIWAPAYAVVLFFW
jgi:hypothetical protein